MKHTRRTVRTGIFLAAAATAASGLVAITGPASASTAKLDLVYTCDYPLIGTQDLKGTVTAEVPDELPVGTETPSLTINTVGTILKETTEGLYMMGAATIEGSITAKATAFTPERPTGVPITAGLSIPKTNIPEEGDFQVNATGRAPKVNSTVAGWGRFNIGNLTLKVTPKDAAGNPTALGTLTVECYQKPGANPHNTFHHIYWAQDGVPKPPKPDNTLMATTPPPSYPKDANPAVKSSVDLNYTCQYPVIGSGQLNVKASVDFPEQVEKNHYTERAPVTATATIDSDTMFAIYSLETPLAKIKGSAVTTTPATMPQIPTPPLKARVKLPVAEQQVPPAPEFPWEAEPWPIDTSGSVPPFVFSQAGPGKMDVGNIQLNLVGTTPSGELHPALHEDPSNPGHLLDVVKVPCTLNAGQPNTTIAEFTITEGGGGQDVEAPTVPQNVQVTKGDPATSTLKVTWDPSADTGTGVGGYNVFQNGQKVATVTDGATSFTATGLNPDTEYTFEVSAFDKATPPNESAKSAPTKGTTDAEQPPVDEQAPTVPQNVQVTKGDPATSTLKVTWEGSTDLPTENGTGVGGYNVFRNGEKVATVTSGTEYTATGLAPDTEYTFEVSAFDKATPPNESAKSAPVKGRTQPQTSGDSFGYNLTGSSFIKAANGTVPLTGGITGTVEASGAFTGDLKLNKSKGSFKVLGFLPATADIAFTQSGRTTGTLTGANLTSNSKVVVNLQSVKVLGFQIGGGANCKTTSPADVTLKSTDFSRNAGGALTGTYTLPAVEGCGPLTPLISSLTAGPGNTVNVKLTRSS